MVATLIVTGLPVQVAVPLVQVAVVGLVHPGAYPIIGVALTKAPLARVTVAVPPEQPLLKLLKKTWPLPLNPLPPLMPVIKFVGTFNSSVGIVLVPDVCSESLMLSRTTWETTPPRYKSPELLHAEAVGVMAKWLSSIC